VPLLDPPMLDPPGAEVELPGVVVEVPPAPLESPCCCRQRSFSRPSNASQRAGPEVVAPVDGEMLLPLVPTEGVPTEGVEGVDGVDVLLPVPRPPEPEVPPEVCAKAAVVAKSAAAVAETMSFSFMDAPSF
jgi:hypothetical protein